MMLTTKGEIVGAMLVATCPHCGRKLFAFGGQVGKRSAPCCAKAYHGFVVVVEDSEAEQAEAA